MSGQISRRRTLFDSLGNDELYSYIPDAGRRRHSSQPNTPDEPCSSSLTQDSTTESLVQVEQLTLSPDGTVLRLKLRLRNPFGLIYAPAPLGGWQITVVPSRLLKQDFEDPTFSQFWARKQKFRSVLSANLKSAVTAWCEDPQKSWHEDQNGTICLTGDDTDERGPIAWLKLVVPTEPSSATQGTSSRMGITSGQSRGRRESKTRIGVSTSPYNLRNRPEKQVTSRSAGVRTNASTTSRYSLRSRTVKQFTSDWDSRLRRGTA